MLINKQRFTYVSRLRFLSEHFYVSFRMSFLLYFRRDVESYLEHDGISSSRYGYQMLPDVSSSDAEKSKFFSCHACQWRSTKRLNGAREKALLAITTKIFDDVVKGSALLKFSIDDVQISGLEQAYIIIVPLRNRSIIYLG